MQASGPWRCEAAQRASGCRPNLLWSALSSTLPHVNDAECLQKLDLTGALAPCAPYRPSNTCHMPRYFVTLIVAIALFMETMDSTVIATSLPAIAADLHEDPIALKLALTSYLLSLAVFIPLSGWAADRFGARTVFRAAIVVFTLGSAACGFAHSLLDFVLFRIVQGIGGAMMVPVGRLVILRTVPKSELISALAWLTIPALMGPVIGPPLGGFITTFASWRWIFWINIPLGIIGAWLILHYIPSHAGSRDARFDATGFVLTATALASVIHGLSLIAAGGNGSLAGGAFVAIGAAAGYA